MSVSKDNYVRGETNPIQAKVATIQAVALGDLLGLSTGYVYRAEDQAYTSTSQAQYDFAANFAGVAVQRKAANVSGVGTGGGPANRIRVATEGVFEFDCFATTHEVGVMVGVAKASGSALDSAKVDAVTQRERAIGVVEEPKTISAATKVKVRIFSTKIFAPIDKN